MTTTHSTAAGLLEAILREPDADDLRLICADWLEDHGAPERAEFIRLQLDIARPDAELVPELPDETLDDLAQRTESARRVLTLREAELISHNLLWSDDIAQALDCAGLFFMGDHGPTHGYGGTHWTYRRGFIGRVFCSREDWLACGPTVVSKSPVTAVKLAGMKTVRYRVYAPGGDRVFPDAWVHCWTQANITPASDVGPELLDWLHLAPSLNAENSATAWHRAEFFDEAAAHRALSWAAVAWARDAVGLPQLPMPEGMTP